MVEGEEFAELLDRPLGGRVLGDVEMDHPPGSGLPTSIATKT
jgi:hypothetical protein